MNFFEILKELLAQSGFAALTWRSCVMILIAFVLLYLAIKKQFEPLLLLPIAFGMFLANLPLADLMKESGIPQVFCVASTAVLSPVCSRV